MEKPGDGGGTQEESAGSGLASVDGFLDSAQVDVGEVVDVTGFLPGRHTLVVIARDNDGNEAQASVDLYIERVDAIAGPSSPPFVKVPAGATNVTMLLLRLRLLLPTNGREGGVSRLTPV